MASIQGVGNRVGSLRAALYAFAALASLVGCDRPGSPTESGSAAPVPIAAPARLQNGTILPAGTILTDSVDATGRRFIHFRLPDGYGMVSADQAGGPVALAMEGGITCTCTQGTGCNPFRAVMPGAGEVIGCTMSGSCTRCTQSITAVAPAGRGTILQMDRRGDILHVAAGVHVQFVEPQDPLPCPSEAVMRSEVFVRGVTRFLDQVQISDRARARSAGSREELPAGYHMMPINAYGKLIRVPVETALLTGPIADLVTSIGRPSRGAAAAPALESGTTCACLSGDSGCTYQRRRALIGYAEWCEAGACTSCRMEF